MRASLGAFRVSPLTAAVALLPLALVAVSGPTVKAQESRGKPALMKPAELNEQAPATFKVNFETSRGPFVVDVHRDWAPLGVDRIYNLVKRGFFDDTRFFRVIPGFLAQFGVHGDPTLVRTWYTARIPDDPPGKQSNKKGSMAFVAGGVGRRTTQVFINLADNATLDAQVAPFGQVVAGMSVVEQLYGGYGEPPPTGKGPDTNRLYSEGNPYLEKEFPQMDYIKVATIIAP